MSLEELITASVLHLRAVASSNVFFLDKKIRVYFLVINMCSP